MAKLIANIRLDDRQMLDLCLKVADQAMLEGVHAGDAIRRFFGELATTVEESIYSPWDDPGWKAADDPTFDGLQ